MPGMCQTISFSWLAFAGHTPGVHRRELCTKQGVPMWPFPMMDWISLYRMPLSGHGAPLPVLSPTNMDIWLAVQSSAQTCIRNTILFNYTSNNAWHNQAHWLVGTPYLSTIASNELFYWATNHRVQNFLVYKMSKMNKIETWNPS